MGFFTTWVEVFQRSGMYQNYLAYLPEGLNNPYFLLLIIIGILIFLILTVKNSIMAILYNKKNKQRIAELREQQEEAERLRQEEREQAREALDLVRQMSRGGIPMAAGVQAGSELAEIDELTGLFNRRGYDKHFQEAKPNTMSIIYMDVNNLKKTNDSMGHTFGDKLILATAGCIKELWPNEGHRTGGDEFIVITNDRKNVIEQKVSQMRNKLAKLTEADTYGLEYQTAVGYASGDGIMSKKEIEELAEKNMYINKKELKEKGTHSLLGVEENHSHDEKELYSLKNAKEMQADQNYKDDDNTREKIDYVPLLNEKMGEDRPKEEADGLDDILSNLENKRANEQALKSFEQKNEETKRKNMELLDRKVKNNFRVEKKA